jgi:hypothetical protein
MYDLEQFEIPLCKIKGQSTIYKYYEDKCPIDLPTEYVYIVKKHNNILITPLCRICPLINRDKACSIIYKATVEITGPIEICCDT